MELINIYKKAFEFNFKAALMRNKVHLKTLHFVSQKSYSFVLKTKLYENTSNAEPHLTVQ